MDKKAYSMTNPRNDPAHGWEWSATVSPLDVEMIRQFEGVQSVINWAEHQTSINANAAPLTIFADPRYDVDDTWLRLCEALDSADRDRALESMWADSLPDTF